MGLKLLFFLQANAMAVKIGYPSYILNNTALDEEYTYVSFKTFSILLDDDFP